MIFQRPNNYEEASLESKKLVLFGAGKIGRSFIGQLFSCSGYEVVFIDIDKKVIAALNEKRKYRVILKSDEGNREILVENVRGIHGSKAEEIASEIATADIMAISVGRKAIPSIAPGIARGIELRSELNPDFPLDIILAENLRDAPKVVGRELDKNLLRTVDREQYLGLIETSIGKMVPIMPKEDTDKDPLLVYAEPYNSLILDRKGFKNPIPEVTGLSPKMNMRAWADRKLFIHNLGHAAAAYYGFRKYPELVYLYDLMAKSDVYRIAGSTMRQAADILMRHYPEEFTKDHLEGHIEDLLRRFSNKALGDTVYRVGTDLYRKLGPEDRMIGVLKLALKYGLPYDRILHIIVCAIDFRAVNEQGIRSDSDNKFSAEAELGISHILESVCKIDRMRYPQIHDEADKIVI